MMQSSMKQMHMDYTMSQRASSARTAAAAPACTQSASHNAIISILDAIIMASIIITLVTLIGLITLVSNLVLVNFLLALVLVLVIFGRQRTPWMRTRA